MQETTKASADLSDQPFAERKLAAILAADVVGFSRMLGADEASVLEKLRQLHGEVVEPLIAEQGGRIFKLMGDGLLAEFASAVLALRAAISIQDFLKTRNAGEFGEPHLELRIGVHQGEVVVDNGDLLGDGVNVAARLESLAEPGGICISARVYEDAVGKIELQAQDMGEQELRNICRPVRVYRLGPGSSDSPLPASRDEVGTSAKPSSLLPPEKPCLVVLPFLKFSDDPEQGHFADGLVDDIVTALSRVKSFFVIARHSSFAYKGEAADIKRVGRELGVRYVLEGSVRKSGGRVRINGQLVEAETGHHVWADRFDGGLEHAFDLQDRVTQTVVGAIEANLRFAEIERANARPADKLSAYDLYLRALPHLWSMTNEGNDRCLALLRQAISIEPSYSLAKATAAMAHTFRCRQYWASENDWAEGARLAREAMNDHRDDPSTLRGAAGALAYISHEYELARTAIDRAMDLNPNSAAILGVNGWVRLYLGELAAATGSFQRALRLSPFDPERGFILSGLSVTHLKAGRFEEGLAAALWGLREAPGWTLNYLTAIRCLAELGRLDEARSLAGRLLCVSPEFTVRRFVQQHAIPSEAFRRASAHALRAAGIPE